MKKIKTIRLTSLLASTSVEFHSLVLGIFMTFRAFIKVKTAGGETVKKIVKQ